MQLCASPAPRALPAFSSAKARKLHMQPTLAKVDALSVQFAPTCTIVAALAIAWAINRLYAHLIVQVVPYRLYGVHCMVDVVRRM